MRHEHLRFRVSTLAATVPEGVAVRWRGRELASGPLTIELDQEADPAKSHGVLDYGRRRAQGEFHVQVSFSELADVLEGVGVDPELTRPVRAIPRSEGAILDDHSFALSGTCEMHPHALLPPEKTAATVLPGQ